MSSAPARTGPWRRLALAPDGRPRPDAPFGRGPVAAHALRQVIRTAAAAGSRLPVGAAHSAARVGGTLEWAARPAKRRRLAENLSHAVGRPAADPAVRRLVREEVLNEARRSADLLWALGRPDELLATTEVLGREHLEEALSRGRGMILTSPHVGGWEVATALPRAVVPVPTTALVTDDWLAWAVAPLRAQAGLRVLFDSAPVARAAALLRAGEAVLMLGDYAKDHMRRYPVRFLDARAELPAGVAVLARLCEAPVVPFVVLPIGPRRWRALIEPPVDPGARGDGAEGEHRILQELADRWSRLLRAVPEHWAAVYPVRWLPPGEDA